MRITATRKWWVADGDVSSHARGRVGGAGRSQRATDGALTTATTFAFAKIGGDYALTVELPSTCTQFPSALRVRRYDVTVRVEFF